MLADLQQYYKAQGISAENFRCPHFQDCSSLSPDTFTTAKEAFVSSGYEAYKCPRILFLSLDSGSASRDPHEKTMETVRRQEEVGRKVCELPAHKHWYRTHELAFLLLRHFVNDLTIENVQRYFAHSNSAKCCMNNPGRAQANSRLFQNCREFIPGEIELLAPDVLITQGDHAKIAILHGFTPVSMELLVSAPEEVKMITLSGHKIIWIHTYHPRNPNSKKNRENYPLYERLVTELLRSTWKVLPIVDSGINLKKFRRKTVISGIEQKDCQGNYIWLENDPQTPDVEYPSLKECLRFEFIKMSQLCEITERHGLKRSPACDAFGGDKGKINVILERTARVVCHGKTVRKYVLTSSALEYLKEVGIVNWQ